MEGLPVFQVRRGHLIRVVIGVALGPVGGRDSILGTVLGLAVQLTVRVPRDALLRHLVRLGLVALAAGRVAQNGAGEGVVEHRVGDQAAGEVRLALVLVDFERVAARSIHLAVRLGVAFELIGVEGIDVASVVLVEVGHVVVEQDGRAHVLRNVEAEVASVGGDVGTGISKRRLDVAFNSPARVDGLVVGLEGGVDKVAGHGREVVAIVVIGGVGNAVGVVKAEFLDLSAGVVKQTADGREDYADDEE